MPWSISKAVAAQGGAGRSDTNIDAINYTAVLDLLLHQSAAILLICGRHSHLQKQAMFPVSKRPSCHRYFVLISCVLLLLLLQLSRKWTLDNCSSKARYTLATKLIQHGRLCWKSTVAETGNKSATKSTVAIYVQLCFRYGRLRCCSVYGAKATRSTLNKVDRVEFNFVASVYRA